MTAARVTLLAAVTIALLAGAQTASALIASNTIDDVASHKRDGRLVRATGPIACTRRERIAITVTVRQPATAARARGRWNGRCTGEVLHWRVKAHARSGARFEDGRGRVCAAATTRRGSRVTDTRRWCERVQLTTRMQRR